MKHAISIFMLLILLPVNAHAELPSGPQLLEQCINYHDPQSQWADFAFEIQVKQNRPDGSGRTSTLKVDRPADFFAYISDNGEDKIERIWKDGKGMAVLNGSSNFDEETATSKRVRAEDVVMYRNYWLYLLGLPMKLKDAGTIIDPEVSATKIGNIPALAFKVTYEETTGSDTWLFYCDLSTSALLGCKFWHEEESDGEIIYFSGELEIESMKFPAARKWYRTANNEYLGEDHLLSASRIKD